MGINSGMLGPAQLRWKEVKYFTLSTLNCVVHAMHHSAFLLKDKIVICNMFDNI